MTFAENGVILVFGKFERDVPCMDVELLSCFQHEKEVLFFGGDWSLEICEIRKIEDEGWKSFKRQQLRAIQSIHSFLNEERRPPKVSEQCKKVAIDMMNTLNPAMTSQQNDSCCIKSLYIKQLLEFQMRSAPIPTVFDWNILMDDFPFFNCFMNADDRKLIRISTLCQMIAKQEHIILKMPHGFTLDSKCFAYILKDLLEVHELSAIKNIEFKWMQNEQFSRRNAMVESLKTIQVQQSLLRFWNFNISHLVTVESQTVVIHIGIEDENVLCEDDMWKMHFISSSKTEWHRQQIREVTDYLKVHYNRDELKEMMDHVNDELKQSQPIDSVSPHNRFESVIDENHKLEQFCGLTALHKISALLLLEKNEWNLVSAINDFFDLNDTERESLRKLELYWRDKNRKTTMEQTKMHGIINDFHVQSEEYHTYYVAEAKRVCDSIREQQQQYLILSELFTQQNVNVAYEFVMNLIVILQSSPDDRDELISQLIDATYTLNPTDSPFTPFQPAVLQIVLHRYFKKEDLNTVNFRKMVSLIVDNDSKFENMDKEAVQSIITSQDITGDIFTKKEMNAAKFAELFETVKGYKRDTVMVIWRNLIQWDPLKITSLRTTKTVNNDVEESKQSESDKESLFDSAWNFGAFLRQNARSTFREYIFQPTSTDLTGPKVIQLMQIPNPTSDMDDMLLLKMFDVIHGFGRDRDELISALVDSIYFKYTKRPTVFAQFSAENVDFALHRYVQKSELNTTNAMRCVSIIMGSNPIFEHLDTTEILHVMADRAHTGETFESECKDDFRDVETFAKTFEDVSGWDKSAMTVIWNIMHQWNIRQLRNVHFDRLRSIFTRCKVPLDIAQFWSLCNILQEFGDKHDELISHLIDANYNL